MLQAKVISNIWEIIHGQGYCGLEQKIQTGHLYYHRVGFHSFFCIMKTSICCFWCSFGFCLVWEDTNIATIFCMQILPLLFAKTMPTIKLQDVLNKRLTWEVTCTAYDVLSSQKVLLHWVCQLEHLHSYEVNGTFHTQSVDMNIINTNVYEHVEYWFQICMYACVASLNQSNHSPARIMFLGYLLS